MEPLATSDPSTQAVIEFFVVALEAAKSRVEWAYAFGSCILGLDADGVSRLKAIDWDTRVPLSNVCV